MKKMIFVMVILLLTVQFSLASEPVKNDGVDGDVETHEKALRLDKIDDRLLSENLDKKTRASLLFEKAKIQMEIGPRTPTVLILSAIKLDPDKPEYKAYLKEVYDTYWKNLDMSKDDYRYEDFSGIKRAVEETLSK